MVSEVSIAVYDYTTGILLNTNHMVYCIMLCSAIFLEENGLMDLVMVCVNLLKFSPANALISLYVYMYVLYTCLYVCVYVRIHACVC